MDLTELAGTTFGPEAHRITESHVADFIAATSDDADRWTDHAPPGYAAALLFRLAPDFLWSDSVRPFTKVLLHSEQQFNWFGEFGVGDLLEISATVGTVRERGGMYFVGFAMRATSAAETILESSSTFLMGAKEVEPAANELTEPEATERGRCDLASDVDVQGDIAQLVKSASRADLVHYAAASGDFNPLHWDHATAVAAGVPGVIAHGLLVASWAAQAAVAHADNDGSRLATMTLRFRNPLFPAVPALVTAQLGEGGSVDLLVTAGDDKLVTGRAALAQADTP